MGFKLVLLMYIVYLSSNVVKANQYFINCGSLHNTTISDRIFLADNYSSTYLSTFSDILANYNTNNKHLKLYKTARIFTNMTRYSFPIGDTGKYFIRLHFFPFTYQNFELSKAQFTVHAYKFTLLSNYTPPQYPTMKEFSLNVMSNELNVILDPAFNSLGFLNAIEVLYVPKSLIQDDASTKMTKIHNYSLLDMALETVSRVNMGGQLVESDYDSLWRTWFPDFNFLEHTNFSVHVKNSTIIEYSSGLATSDIAPIIVYSTCTRLKIVNGSDASPSVKWNFDVDQGFQYLIRFHLCDIVSVTVNNMYFNIFVDSWLAFETLDVTDLAHGFLATPIYVDFITPLIPQNKISVSLEPSIMNKVRPDAILNGLEIMKLNNEKNSLVAAPMLGSSKIRAKKKKKNNIRVIVGVCIACGITFLILFTTIIFLYNRKKTTQAPSQKTSTSPSTIEETEETTTAAETVDSCNNPSTTIINVASNMENHITYEVVEKATNNFDENWVIGIGGFGKVYKGFLGDGTKVAVKRGSSRSEQGLNEFKTEIEMLIQFRHRHLVSLIGFCAENNERILVYEYMENGTLRSQLHDTQNHFLCWKQRLQICIGAARGMHYLHFGSSKSVIHRDIKSSNILLDENYRAKVADFGLAKTVAEADQADVSTTVKGTFGYLDPEYFKRQKLTRKSDVYSFGVLLFEVLCARPVLDTKSKKGTINLAEWALECEQNGELEQIIDPRLQGTIKPECLRKYGEIARNCLANYGVDRPTITVVLSSLEHVLQLQDVVVANDSKEEITTEIGDVTCSYKDDEITSEDDIPSGSMSRVFSELVKNERQ